MLKFALRNLWAYKRRLLTSAFSVVLGVSFLAGSFVFTDTLKGLFQDLFSSTLKGVDVVVRGPKEFDLGRTGGPYDEGRPSLSDALVTKIRAVPGVAAAENSIQGYAQLIDKKGKLVKTGGAPTFGQVWAVDTKINAFRIFSGRPPRSDDEIVIDRSLAKKTGYRVGDRVTVSTAGPAETFRVSGDATFGSSDGQLGATTIFFTKATAQRLMLRAGETQSVIVRGAGGLSEETLRRRVASALTADRTVNGKPIEVITGAAFDKEIQSILDTVFGFINLFFTAFAVVALFVSIFVISNSFSIVVAQRTKEMAMLRAIGATRRQVLGSTFLEALFVGLLASAVGVAGGLLVALGIRTLLEKVGGAGLPSSGLVLAPRTIIVGMLVGTIVTVLSSVGPAVRASRVKPLAALRDVAIDRSGRSRTRLVIGAVLAGLSAIATGWGMTGQGSTGAQRVGAGAALALVAIVFLGPLIARPVAGALGRAWFGWVVVAFGALMGLGGLAALGVGAMAVPLRVVLALAALGLGSLLVRTGLVARTTAGQIARENAVRSPARTSATALALTIGTALVSAILVLSSSITTTFRGALEDRVRADFVVTSATDFGFPTAARDRLERVPGVTAISALRLTTFRYGFIPRNRTMGGVDPRGLEQVLDLGRLSGRLTDLDQPDTVALDRKSAADNGLRIGSSLRITFANGTAATLKIVATYDNAEGLGNVYYLTGRATLDKYVPANTDGFIYVRTDGRDRAAFRAAADRALQPFPAAELKTKKEFADDRIGQLQQFLVLINALLLLAIIIAILGIANTLKLSIHERTREIGLLRAVGMSRAQIRAAIRWEAIVVATFGAVLGVVIGTGFGSALVTVIGRDGSVGLTVPAAQLLPLTLTASVVGLYAARRPAKDAARLDILRAIATE